MFNKLKAIKQRYDELSGLLSDPNVFSDNERFTALSKEQSSLQDIVETYAVYTAAEKELAEAKEMALMDDKELSALAKEEEKRLTAELDNLTETLKVLLVPKDPNDNKNAVLEIRAGTGGDEAALFGADLLRMYTRFSEREGFKMEYLSSNYTEKGGVKEVVVNITGKASLAN